MTVRMARLIPAMALIALAAFLFWRNQASDLSRSRKSVVAVGLRGQTEVNKPLSKTQIGRLEQHFLAVPPAMNNSSAVSATVSSTLSQVESINAFNRNQPQ